MGDNHTDGEIPIIPIQNEESDIPAKLAQVVMEKKKLTDEFDNQRARMKDLFLQKEEELMRKTSENRKLQTELDELKSQLLVKGMELESNVEVERKAAEEIASLQHLIHETVEESTSSKTLFDSEYRKLQYVIKKLEDENNELKYEKQNSPHHNIQEQSSLAPGLVLSAVTKKLVKKLGADAFSSKEDEMRDDSELEKSLIGPLEEEMKALKDKLRATDEQLQMCKHCHQNETEKPTNLQITSSSNTSLTDSISKPSLVIATVTTATNTSSFGETSSNSSSTNADTSKTTISNTSTVTSPVSTNAIVSATCDMCSNYEAQLVREQKRSAECESKVALATKAVDKQKEYVMKEIGFRKEMEEKWNEKREEHKTQVCELTKRTETAEKKLALVEKHFEEMATDIRNKLAIFSTDREQILAELKRIQEENENLVGKYSVHSQQLQSEFINLPDTVEELHELILKMQSDLVIEKIAKETAGEKINSLQSNIVILNERITNELQIKDSIEHSLHAEIDNLTDKLIKFDAKYNELKVRNNSLMQELGNSEMVQKDFVLLSQNLQVQLEKLRVEDGQVRWEHEDDVETCPTCRVHFAAAVDKRRTHCRHCGQIFCAECLQEIRSGPKQRVSRVCDMCHTLLKGKLPPYFSNEVPPPQHTPD